MAVAVERWGGLSNLTPMRATPARPAAGVLGLERTVLGANSAVCFRKPFERDKFVGSCIHLAEKAYCKGSQTQLLRPLASSRLSVDSAPRHRKELSCAVYSTVSGLGKAGAPCLLHERRFRAGSFRRAYIKGGTLYRTHRTKTGVASPYHRYREGASCRRYRTVTSATNDARTFPKVQTGVTLKWVSPNRTSGEKEKHLTATVLESICPDAVVDEQQKVEFSIKTVAWRKRHITASVEVEAGMEKVWQVLTDYEQLADFIPNLAKSERIPCPTRGRIWLLQLGVQSSMYWQIEARVVLDLEERFDAPGGPELHFSMVEGDFKLFAGKWAIRESDRPGHVTLHYEVDVLPRAILPTAFVERIVQADLPRNLRAIANRAQTLMTSPPVIDVRPSTDMVSSGITGLTSSQVTGTGSNEPGFEETGSTFSDVDPSSPTSSSDEAMTSSAGGAITSSADGAMTASSSPTLTSHPLTAFPASLVTVATGAAAGLNLEVSWWSGPGQPPNPGLISPAGNSLKLTEMGQSSSKTAGGEMAQNPNTAGDGNCADGVTQNGFQQNGVEQNGVKESGFSQQLPGVTVTETGLLVEGVAGFGDGRDRSTGPGPETGTAVLETVPRPALPHPELGPHSKPAQSNSNGQGGTEQNGESGRGREEDSEPVVELVDEPYFPAECPVISPDDKAVRAQLRHRIDEVHLRRMDDLLEKGGVHRRVVAAITIAATVEVVWGVLTDYEGLQDFIPNLVKSKVVSRHPDERRVRLHQIGVKCLCYMVLHAQTTMDVTELPHREIRFSQVSGDFDSFEGRWFLEPLGPGHTLLKYAVETRVRRNSLLPESLMEEVIYEDLPANLCAIRKRVESNKSIYSDPSFLPRGNDPPETRPSQPGGRSWGSRTPRLDVAHVSETSPRKKVLRKLPITTCAMFLEAEPSVPSSGVKPKPKRVRTNRAVTENIPKAKKSNATGTSQTPAKTLAKPLTKSSAKPLAKTPAKPLAKTRRVKADYSDFGALEAALSAFIATHGVPGVMPSRSELRAAGRVDLERGMRLHGGPSSVAAKLGLGIQHQQKPARFWSDLENIEREIKAFQPTIGLDPDVMPSRQTLEKAGRFDIARALHRWGGAKALAAKLNLKTASRKQTQHKDGTEAVKEKA